jgi:hypothetical protein
MNYEKMLQLFNDTEGAKRIDAKTIIGYITSLRDYVSTNLVKSEEFNS